MFNLDKKNINVDKKYQTLNSLYTDLLILLNKNKNIYINIYKQL